MQLIRLPSWDPFGVCGPRVWSGLGEQPTFAASRLRANSPKDRLISREAAKARRSAGSIPILVVTPTPNETLRTLSG